MISVHALLQISLKISVKYQTMDKTGFLYTIHTYITSSRTLETRLKYITKQISNDELAKTFNNASIY